MRTVFIVESYPILSLRHITLSFSGPPVLDDIELRITRGERIGIVGRNGMGKSTLLKIIEGEIEADSGVIDRRTGVTIASLCQEIPTDLTGSVFEVVASGLPKLHGDDWQVTHKISKIISHLDLNETDDFSHLSGGVKRRVLLAKALVNEPDILLLDEPTNHLDIDSILWLEKFLLNYSGTILLITHDRVFLQNVANRIVELDRGQLTSWPGDYQKYVQGKQHALAVEQTQQALFDKRLAQEETWIRQGIKARRTRNEGRVRALEKLREVRLQRRDQIGRARLHTHKIEASGKIVIEAKDLHYQIDNKTIINDFSTTIMRGDKVGLIGPNGCGKTTLINLLLGKLQPQQGSCKLGTRLELAYFDQLRSELDINKTVQDNVGQGSDFITINEKRKHIISYLEDFLFKPERARSLVRTLSGGERNRVLLAKLMIKPANVLVLDEPTNDLDVETLELLEALLVEFAGTIIIVSHDREFLNNVVSSTIAYQGDATFKEFVGMLQTPEGKNIPPHWLSYINVDDLEATVEKATGLGATVCVPATPVGDFGKFAVVTDPTGAQIAFWKSFKTN